jgi:hypothetical protein
MGGFAGQTAAQFKVEEFGGGNGNSYRSPVDLVDEGYDTPPSLTLYQLTFAIASTLFNFHQQVLRLRTSCVGITHRRRTYGGHGRFCRRSAFVLILIWSEMSLLYAAAPVMKGMLGISKTVDQDLPSSKR